MHQVCVAEAEGVCVNRPHGFRGTTGLGDGQADLVSLFHLQCLQFCFHTGFGLMEILVLFPVAVQTHTTSSCYVVLDDDYIAVTSLLRVFRMLFTNTNIFLCSSLLCYWSLRYFCVILSNLIQTITLAQQFKHIESPNRVVFPSNTLITAAFMSEQERTLNTKSHQNCKK